MQRFLNNWSTTLQAPLLAGDPDLSVPPALAARVNARLQGPDDFCDLTIHPEGAGPEIVRITGTGPSTLIIGERGREGTTTPASWPAGTVVRCAVTAGWLESLQAQPVGVPDAQLYSGPGPLLIDGSAAEIVWVMSESPATPEIHLLQTGRTRANVVLFAYNQSDVEVSLTVLDQSGDGLTNLDSLTAVSSIGLAPLTSGRAPNTRFAKILGLPWMAQGYYVYEEDGVPPEEVPV